MTADGIRAQSASIASPPPCPTSPTGSYAISTTSRRKLGVGDQAHSRWFSEKTYEKISGRNKTLVIAPNARHIDPYGDVEKIPFDKLEEFFAESPSTSGTGHGIRNRRKSEPSPRSSRTSSDPRLPWALASAQSPTPIIAACDANSCGPPERDRDRTEPSPQSPQAPQADPFPVTVPSPKARPGPRPTQTSPSAPPDL